MILSGLPDGVEPIYVKMKGLCSTMQEMPDVWFKSLVRSGNMSSLVDLEASVQASLGPKIEKHLRVSKLALHLAMSEEQRDVVLSKTALSKADVVRCIVNLVEVNEASAAGEDCLCPLDSLAAVKEHLNASLKATTTNATDKLSERKKALKDLCLQLAPLKEAMVDEDGGKAAPILAVVSRADSPIQGAVAGYRVMLLVFVKLLAKN